MIEVFPNLKTVWTVDMIARHGGYGQREADLCESDLHGEFQVSHDYIVKPCFKVMIDK